MRYDPVVPATIVGANARSKPPPPIAPIVKSMPPNCCAPNVEKILTILVLGTRPDTSAADTWGGEAELIAVITRELPGTLTVLSTTKNPANAAIGPALIGCVPAPA